MVTDQKVEVEPSENPAKEPQADQPTTPEEPTQAEVDAALRALGKEADTKVPAPTEPKFTQTDIDAALKKQYDQLNTKLSTQGQELKKLREQVATPPTPVQPSRSAELILEVLKGQQQTDGEPNPRIAVLEQALAQEKLDVARDAKFQEQQREALAERGKLEARIEEAGHDPSTRDFDDIWDDWDDRNKIDANWARTNRKLTRVLEDLAPKAEPKAEVKSEDKAKDEAARAEAEEEGALKTETGGPSASGLSDEAFKQSYIRGDWVGREDDYAKERRKRGIA